LDTQLTEQARSRDHESSDECGQAKNQHDVTQEDGQTHTRAFPSPPRVGPSWHLKAVPVVGYPTQEMKIERSTVGHGRQQGRLARSS
jgi:hypothetical protein